MRKLDRALIAWGKGQGRINIGPYWLTGDRIFHEGVPLCARLKDMAGSPFILVRETLLSGSKVDTAIDPKQHFRGRKWRGVSTADFDSAINNFQSLHAARAMKTLTLKELGACGSVIVAARKFSERHNLELTIFDEDYDDLTLLGTRFCLRGKFVAICIYDESDAIYGGKQTKYKIFDSFEDAVWFKMKNDSVKLYDLTK